MLHDDFPRTIPQQVAQLTRLGLQGSPEDIACRLRAVSYYRLSSYWHPYLNNDGAFKDATSIDDIWNRYMFDRELRLLLLDAIERIEVCMRTTIAHRHATHFGPFSYANDINSLQETAGRVTRTQWHERVHHEVRQNREILLTRTRDRNGDTHTAPPVWVAAEVMSMGTIVSFFNLCHKWMRKEIADDFDTSERVFSTWMLALHAGRNIAAHHGRLWNRELGIKPLIPFTKSKPLWHDPFTISNNRVFALLSIAQYCLAFIEPQCGWKRRVVNLLQEYPQIPPRSMGMPTDWRRHAIWRDT